MNDLTVKSSGNISPWKQAVQAAQTGSFLLFKKGDWTIREEEVSDLEMIANPFEIYFGFQYWRDQTPGEVQMVRIDQLHLRPRRQDLGELDPDQDKWETGVDGVQKDPWVPTVRMILKHLDSDEFLIFTSSSHGGRGAVNDFCAAYDKDRLRFPGQVPVVRLGVRTYLHKKFGKVPNPVFEVVRWTTWDGSEAPPEATPREQIAADLDDTIPDFAA